MNSLRIGLSLFLIVAGCSIEFNPDPGENREQLVVEGIITDQNRVNRIKLSKSLSVGKPLSFKAVSGAIVTVTDENEIVTTLTESPAGIYSTDSTEFRGRIGGRYSLNIRVNNVNYLTDFIEMKPVPAINSLYYEKIAITSSKDTSDMEEGCRIYVDSFDPSGECLFFRWDYSETWEYRIPYAVTKRVCYVTERSDEILIKNTSLYSQARVTKYPVLLISNKSDRLKERYSILVNQYSLNEAEYYFWERVQNISQNVGDLYDITPMAIPSNIRSADNPEETVLGYFSVSAVTQKRLFIKDHFFGLPHFFIYCATDTVQGRLPETGLDSEYWVIEDYGDEIPPFWVITTFRECADCTTRGSSVMPSFWREFR
ncbi:MAG: DUF4249 domain-containing protein [Bacteroidales bacterium]